MIMRYLVLVSHGTFAPGYHNALGMIVGADRDDILSTSMLDGMALDTYEENLRKLVAHIQPTDEVILLGDLAAGSPLTRAAQVLSEQGLLDNSIVVGGMNLPMAITAACADPDESLEDVLEELLECAREEVRQVTFEVPEDENDDDI